MATVNIGNIKFTWQGAYNSSTAYAIDDIVSYNGSSYVCILASTGNLPTNTTYWNVMAQGGTDITSISGLAQGDILYYNGTDWVRLGAGTNGQFLKTQGTGANPIWSDNSAVVASAYGSSSISSGYEKNGNGFIFQWGAFGTLGAATSGSVSFPITFPNYVYAVVLQLSNNNNNLNTFIELQRDPSTSGFSWWQNNNGQTSRLAYYMATGK